MTTATTMTRPIIAFWKTGKKNTEQGWSFDGKSLSMSDLGSTRSYVDLEKKGVPASICASAKHSGYAPSEIGQFLEENGYHR
jgi:hypothetical protein